MHKFKKMIKRRGLKICWVADRIKVDRSLLSRFLSGDRPMPPKVYEKLSKLLGE